MVTKELDALSSCKKYLEEQQSFVLQGGAGSGKTESVKNLLVYLSSKYPHARAICITHTNNAVHEIQERIGDKYSVSTIHTFLHNLIKKYKKNIHTVIPILYIVTRMERLDDGGQDENEYKKAEYKRYKDIYNKFAKKMYSIKKETCEKVIGKVEYDKDPIYYNNELNKKIDDLNTHIIDTINSMDYMKIRYNETKFDSFKDLTYGHDGLLTIAHLLFKNYPILGKIVKDKYDYIFIDEYQDTKQEVVHDFISLVKQKKNSENLTLCLFGDSMQAIYSDGIGSIEPYIDTGDLIMIPKSDNYRCSYEVIEIINTLRLDNIQQKVALAKNQMGEVQKEINRHGDVKVFFAICDNRPKASSSADEKEKYSLKVDYLINEAKKSCEKAKILVLTNKSIAEKEGFKQLYKVFDERYSEVNERIEDYLHSIQISDICDICLLYETKKYNPVIKSLKSGGYVFRSHQDKLNLKKDIEELLLNSKISLYEALRYAVDKKIVKITETCRNILDSNDKFKKDLIHNIEYQTFKKYYSDGLTTNNKMKKVIEIASEEEFHYYEGLYKKEKFIKNLFSESVKFSDAINFSRYSNENSDYITMHKTKGSSIDSVIVVMEEYYWNKYDFSTLYDIKRAVGSQKRWENSQKLIYVACSRARKSLRCVRLLLKEEVDLFKVKFPEAEEIKIINV
ncbi:ATP-dependent helicase [Listeria rocourtiae]|uniref:UvrD-helicase domain-containing protein n=1 Tax=Listeria rocourtiae TaxID=647910 RepID=UPI001624051E|nr:UvrD-helicase domain-containing protein [Listeria rocourtiae]MBC1606030.1 ATP-dependent helicase [Listeria rocourtiae]